LSFHPRNLILTSDEYEGEDEGSEENAKADAANDEHEDDDDAQSRGVTLYLLYKININKIFIFIK
jgi:hypothetical protein